MKRINRNITKALAALTLTLGACSEDFDLREGEMLPDGQGVVVYVPRVTGEAATRAAEPRYTRADGDAWDFEENEGRINEAYIFAFPVNNEGKGTIIRQKLSGGSVGSGDYTGYTGYELSIPADTYRMYVVANYSFTDDELEETGGITEDKLLEKQVGAPAALTASNGLPMSCATFDIKAGSETKANASKVEVLPGGNMAIKADLKFAVAKLRVTVLNDLKSSEKIGGVKVDPAYATSYLIGGQVNLLNDGSSVSGGKTVTGGYFQMPSLKDEKGNPIAIADVSVDNLEALSGEPAEGKAWAWQGTAYLGENLFNASKTNTTTLSVEIGDGDAKEMEIKSENGIERSHMYDVVGTPGGDFVLAIQRWDPEIMALSLRGAYFLHLDTTEIEELKAGEGATVWYETNGALKFDGNPKLDDRDIYSFSVSEEDQTISIDLASHITREDIDRIKADVPGWDVIRIQSGTIIKYIKIGDIVYNEYLNSDIETITVGLSELIGSGSYTSYITIPVETNLKSFTVTKSATWNNIIHETNDDGVEYAVKSLMLQTPQGDNLSDEPAGVTKLSDYVYTINTGDDFTGTYNLQLQYNGLNEGRKFWNDDHDLGIDIEGDITEADGSTTHVRKTVIVKVRASQDKYKIHVKVNKDWGKDVHIYVYQCLQFPTDMTPYVEAQSGLTAAQKTEYLAYAGKPVGARDNTGDGDFTLAALEYSFTGALAFKGWGLTGEDNPARGTWLDNGFRIFNSNPDHWNGRTNLDRHYNDFDFCKEYRDNDEQDCTYCKTGSSSFNHGWPGIKMQLEDDMSDGYWFYFELSGVATPGKALIIFTQNHGGGYQYPSGAGVPLFDYPSKEGWIDITTGGSKTFRPSLEEESDPVPTIQYTYRIYWPYSSSFNGINMWNGSSAWGDSSYTQANYNSSTPENASKGGAVYKRDSDGAYMEFTTSTKLTGDFNYQKMPGHSNQSSFNASAFEDLGNNVYKYTIGDSMPRKVGLYWDRSIGNEVCFYNGDSFWPDESWTRKAATLINNQYYLIELSTADELSAFDRLSSEGGAGYSFGYGSEATWNSGNHRQDTTVPSAFSGRDITEIYQIWK